jgi:phosphoglycolate phosphatase
VKKICLFDLDGTLTDPKIGIVASIRHSLAKMGRTSPSDEHLVTFIGPPIRKTFESLLETTDKDFVEKAIQHYRDHQWDVGMFEAHVYEGVLPMLQDTKDKSSRLFIVTAKSRPYAERVVRHFGLDRFFNGVYGAELDGRMENKADLLRHLLKAEQVAARDACMIGDRGVDMIAAKEHGIEAIGTLWGYGSGDELLRAGADRLYSNPHQLVPGLGIDIIEASTEDDLAAARGLFQEYAAELNVDLGFQHFAEELEHLREMYAAPKGCLLLARTDHSVFGCVALRAFRDNACEMKRLYVQPRARRTGIGRNLAIEIIRRARQMGYRRMVLDTLESLEAAKAMYLSLGFRIIPPYYENPLSGATYMESLLPPGEGARRADEGA